MDGWVLTALVMFKNIWSSGGIPSLSHTKPESALTCLERESNKHILCAYQKVRFSHQTKWSFAITWNCPSKNADFPQILPRSSASVLMPLWQHLRPLRPVRCSRLAVMGRSWWVQLGWIRGNYKNSKTIRIQKIMGLYWIILSFFGPGWIDIELYVCTWEYALFSAWIRHGFWWLGMVSNGSLSVHMCFVHLRWFRN